MRCAFVLVVAACQPGNVYTLDDLPVTDWTLGLPVHGDGRLLVYLVRTDWSDARGFVRFACDDCTLGDDRTTLALPFLGELDHVDFGHITFDTVRASLDFSDGEMRMTATWRSPDLELDARISGILAPRAVDIALDGCATFRATDALLARDPRTHAVVVTTGAPLAPDGRYTIRIAGTRGALRLLGEPCSVTP